VETPRPCVVTLVFGSYDGRMPSQRCIKTMCIVCAAMDTVVQQGRLHSAAAGVRARMAALERFLLGCGLGGAAAGGVKLDVFPGRCSEAVKRAYSVDKGVYAYVYTDFAVLLVGSPPRVYKSEGRFDHGVGREVGEFFGITGDDLDTISLVRHYPSPEYAEAFSLVRAPWDGEWVVSGDVKVERELFGRSEVQFGGSELSGWAPQCEEIAMDGGRITFRRTGSSETVWRIKDVQPTGFSVLVPCGEGHRSIPLDFAVCVEDFNRLRLDVVRGVETCVKYTLERKARAVLRRFPPLLARAATVRAELAVTEGCASALMEWRDRVEVCVHDYGGGVLLKLGRKGMSYKPEEGSEEKCYTVFSSRMSFQQRKRPMFCLASGGWFDVFFALAGDPHRVVLVGYWKDPDSRPKNLAFKIPFVPCKVWEGDWSVQRLTPLDPSLEVLRKLNLSEVPKKWNTECNEINLTDGAWMKMTDSSGVTTAEWHIKGEPEPLWFIASQQDESVMCEVVVEDYNRIKLEVSTEFQYYSKTGRCASEWVSTVEYTLVRKRG
jgi:hypothetical protein